MNLIPSASGRLCCDKTQSNRNVRKRLVESKRFEAPGFVLPLLLAVSINNPVATQSQQTTPVTVSRAVQEAVERNLSLLAERYNLSVADARIVTARLRPNPALSLYADLLDLAGTGFGAQTRLGWSNFSTRSGPSTTRSRAITKRAQSTRAAFT